MIKQHTVILHCTCFKSYLVLLSSYRLYKFVLNIILTALYAT